jgi:hypothetical protein
LRPHDVKRYEGHLNTFEKYKISVLIIFLLVPGCPSFAALVVFPIIRDVLWPVNMWPHIAFHEDRLFES